MDCFRHKRRLILEIGANVFIMAPGEGSGCLLAFFFFFFGIVGIAQF